jgi:hypothetical protein
MNNSSQTLITFAKNSIKSSLQQQQPHKITLSKARDISKRKGSGGNIVLRQLIDESIQNTGKSELEILETLRFLVDKGKLVLVEDSGVITFRLHKEISEYEERAQRLADAWCAGERAEILTLAILDEEREAFEKAAVLRLEKERQDEAREKKRQRLAFKHSEQRRFRF